VRALKPLVLVPLALVVGVITAAILPRLIGYSTSGQRAIEQQLDQEDRLLCGKFALPPWEHSECTAALAILRHRHEPLLLY
jgi:hypothetical protein